MNERNRYDCENMVAQGRIGDFFTLVREEPELLAEKQDFSYDGPILTRVWEKYPQLTKRLLLELIQEDDGSDLVGMLEAMSLPFEFIWNNYKCYVNGNILFSAVWAGEYELVSRLLELGMDPDGTSRNCYITKEEKYITPYSRWGKMKCKYDSVDFFSFQHWNENPWGLFDNVGKEHLITPLYLAELTGDQEMARILMEAGALSMPSREKMWEEAKAPETGGSVFGNV